MLRLKLAFGTMAGVIAVSFGVASATMLMSSSARLNSVEAVEVAPHAFVYRMAGDFNQTGRSVDAPLVTTARTSVLHIMRCDGLCKMAFREDGRNMASSYRRGVGLCSGIALP
jgi:hypothetical protein